MTTPEYVQLRAFARVDGTYLGILWIVSCASLLLANGVPMKQIQEWLGHSDFSTTANIYAHLDYSSKLTSADAMLNGLGLAPN